MSDQQGMLMLQHLMHELLLEAIAKKQELKNVMMEIPTAMTAAHLHALLRVVGYDLEGLLLLLILALSELLGTTKIMLQILKVVLRTVEIAKRQHLKDVMTEIQTTTMDVRLYAQ